jgi:hypothetical protein
MEVKTSMETVKVEGGQLIDQVKRLIHEGTVRRISIKQDERTIAEFPLTIGVIGVVFAPMLAAVGALAALLTECTIEIERLDDEHATLGEPTNGHQEEPLLTEELTTP